MAADERSTLDPRIRGKIKKRPPTVKREWRKKGRLDELVEALQERFSVEVRPKVGWRGAALNGKGSVALITLTDRGKTLSFHPILAHERVPADILECVVFQGLLMSYAYVSQEKPTKHIMAYPEIAGWIEKEMAALPATEFLIKFYARFWTWVGNL